MTETAGKPSTRRGSRTKGLKIERIHTTEGVHPYDEVTWETRDVVQQNWKTGATIFEQRGSLPEEHELWDLVIRENPDWFNLVVLPVKGQLFTLVCEN